MSSPASLWPGLWLLALVPALWRVGRGLLGRGAGPGRGAIRFWGGALALGLASALLEAAALAGTLGRPAAAVLSLGVLAVIWPWYPGLGLAAVVRRLTGVLGGLVFPAARRRRTAPCSRAAGGGYPLPAAVCPAAAVASALPLATRVRPALRERPAAVLSLLDLWPLDAPAVSSRPAAGCGERVQAHDERVIPDISNRTRDEPRAAQVATRRLPENPCAPFARLPGRALNPALLRVAGEPPAALPAAAALSSAGAAAWPDAPEAALVKTASDLASDSPRGHCVVAGEDVSLPETVFDRPQAAPAALVEPIAELAPLPLTSVAKPHLKLKLAMPPLLAAAAPPPPALASPAPGLILPGLDLLASYAETNEAVSAEALAETGALIEQRLKEFKVPVEVVGASAGPVITRFEVEPALGVRGSQIVGLMKDLARGLGLASIRVVETIPGRTCMGLELPNARRQMIRLSEILDAEVFRSPASRLTLAMGKDIVGNPVAIDLARAPHMLVAGTTGSGKSVAINAMILSLLYRASPEEVRLIMIDPKMLELSVYEGIPHLLAPVVTDMKLAANALNWCVAEMDKRYRLMSALGVRNLAGFNQKICEARQADRPLCNPFSITPESPEPLSTLPLIVVVIDELADLMMVAGKKIEELIARLAQKARAAGIHLILATQRPSVDVITGLIKANIPTRVAFQVSSKIDSRTILDQMGAESLLGQGDMLFLPPGSGYPQRIHGAFVADDEVHRVVEYLKQFGAPAYEEGVLAPLAGADDTPERGDSGADAEADPLYDEATAFVLRTRRASISSVQRQLRIGYNRAARLVEQMEAAGVVSSMGTNGAREVLAPAVDDLRPNYQA